MADDAALERRCRWLRIARRVYNWTLWSFVVVLQLTQVLGGVPSVQRAHGLHATYGRSALEGMYDIPGTNDDPFTDRSIVCSLVGRLYKPQQLSVAMASANSSSKSASSLSVNGYRVLDRQGLALEAKVHTHYVNTCNQIAATLDTIHQICRTLGYSISATYLRVVVDQNNGQDDDATLVLLPSTLPILILPYWDNAVFARYAVPGEDGSACVFRLDGKYADATSSIAVLRAVDRSVRETKTAQWLNLLGGTWRHGWYEHASPTTTRWYSDAISTGGNDTLGLFNRHFDTISGRETDCSAPDVCAEGPLKEWWGTDLYVVEQSYWYQSVAISNGSRKGLFLFSNAYSRYVASIYRLETLISNISVAYLLLRWLVALIALHNTGETVGVGVLGCARSFHLLPILFLPRLKTILAAVFMAGCYFEGDQKTLGEAYFVVYPAIVEVVLLLFSVLNLLAKLRRRRVSDALFGPTLLLLCVVYYMRFDIAQSGWFGIDGRVTTVVSAAEFEAARLFDFFTTKLAYRMNGNIPSLFLLKMALLAAQFLPLAVGYVQTHRQRISSVEKAMALRIALNGGVGQSPIYLVQQFAEGQQGPEGPEATSKPSRAEGEERGQRPSLQKPPLSPKRRSTKPKPLQVAVVPYEVVRAGFLVLGGDVLVSIHDWYWFMLSAPLRKCHVPMDHLRVMVWTLCEDEHGRQAYVKLKGDRPLVYRVTDERFEGIRAWDITSRAIG